MNLISDGEDDIYWEEERQIQEAIDASMDNQSSETITRYYTVAVRNTYMVFIISINISLGITDTGYCCISLLCIYF